MRCSSCQGPFHPATGWVLSPNTVLCGPCAKDFAAWFKGRMTSMSHPVKDKTGKKMDESFAESAAKSIIGG